MPYSSYVLEACDVLTTSERLYLDLYPTAIFVQWNADGWYIRGKQKLGRELDCKNEVFGESPKLMKSKCQSFRTIFHPRALY